MSPTAAALLSLKVAEYLLPDLGLSLHLNMNAKLSTGTPALQLLSSLFHWNGLQVMQAASRKGCNHLSLLH